MILPLGLCLAAAAGLFCLGGYFEVLRGQRFLSQLETLMDEHAAESRAYEDALDQQRCDFARAAIVAVNAAVWSTVDCEDPLVEEFESAAARWVQLYGKELK